MSNAATPPADVSRDAFQSLQKLENNVASVFLVCPLQKIAAAFIWEK
jgi:hypothetical protein